MINQYILGIIVTHLFVIIFLYSLIGKRKNRNVKEIEGDESIKISTNVAENNEYTDLIIVGAGVAGAALAHTLAKDGRRVLVIERDLSEQDRIVGELLQPGGYLKLVELGLEDCADEIDSHPVYGYALIKDDKSISVSYPLEDFHSQIAGRGFHNGRFVQKLRQKAASHPNVKMEEGTVSSLLEEKGIVKGVRYRTKTGEDIKAYAPLTIVCDGCFSSLRRTLCNSKIDVPSCFVGLVVENADLPYDSHGHVILADPSPVLFYQISSFETRCLVDIPGQKVPSISTGDMARYLKTKVAPQLPAKLRQSFIAAVDKGNIKTMHNRIMPAAPKPKPGALLLGDSFNMRHPLTGGGMTVALSDVVIIRDLLRPLANFNDPHAVCKYLEAFYTLRKVNEDSLVCHALQVIFTHELTICFELILQPVASTINILAGALYKVFCATTDEARREMQQACFDYLGLGGNFSVGPLSILCGLNPSPTHLVLHFFAVAIYGVGRLILPFPLPKCFWIGARLLTEASGIILPILQAEGARQMFFPATIPAYHRAPPVKIMPETPA
ncbi:Squalene epoxidase [Dillenia turbinata]|uniref:Squalene monooxygenase n=1 Tax=Dillenia turbinata TaxID=194707 RepID=A0AAN8WC43_9MAGN